MLIRSARREGVPVFFIQHANKSTLVEGSDAWQLHPQIQPLHTERIIHKRQGNAFKETTLREELDSKRVERLVITGLVTHGCVKATCIGAIELEYRVALIEDGHSNFSKQAAQLIEKWNRKLGELSIELKGARAVDFSKGKRQDSETA